jgi:hypothetical protein
MQPSWVVILSPCSRGRFSTEASRRFWPNLFLERWLKGLSWGVLKGISSSGLGRSTGIGRLGLRGKSERVAAIFATVEMTILNASSTSHCQRKRKQLCRARTSLPAQTQRIPHLERSCSDPADPPGTLGGEITPTVKLCCLQKISD